MMPITNPDLPITSGDCQLENFALFEGPDITDITAVDNGCPDVMADIVAEHAANSTSKVVACDVQATGFFAGIYGSRPRTYAISVYLSRCIAFNNDYIVVLHHNAFHWCMRDCIFNQANCWGAS